MDGSFTDSRDGNLYTWVKIGNQVWMAENLKYLPEVIGPGAGSETTPYYYVYDYNGTDVIAAKATANYQNYGALYNWPAAMNGAQSSSANPSTVQGVCPTGWHLPSDAEWTQLVNYVVAQGYANESTINGAGNALKSCRQVNSPIIGNCNTADHPRWESHGTHYGTDVFGFAAHGGGFRHSNGDFPNIAVLGFWWSATGVSSTEALARIINRGLGAIFTDDLPMSYGYSVRCIRD